MDAEKKAVAPAEAKRSKEEERLLNKVWMYLLFLYFGIMVIAIAPRLAPPASNAAAAVPSLPACYDLRHRLTSVSFAAVTLVMQVMLARVLERRPAPEPQLTALAAWPLAVFTWMFVTIFCLSYLEFRVRTYYSEWALAGVVSAFNLAMAARTVMNYLA